MTWFIVRRLLQVVPLVLAITVLSFGIMQLAPGNYLDTLRGQPTINPATIARLTHQFGLDRPWYVQYAKWLENVVFHLNFGYSFTYKIPIWTLLKQRFYYTFLLAFWSTVVSWVVAIPLGVYVGRNRNGIVDRVASFLSYSLISLPGFFVALLLMMLAKGTGWFPIGGATSIHYDSLSQLGKIKDTAWHMFLPVTVLGLRGVAGLMRQQRGSVLEVLSEQYIVAARARGVAERRVVWKHAVRNSINPLITLFGFELSSLLAGSALVENVLAWPGLGRLLLEAVESRDIYVAMGDFVLGGVMLIVGNLIADVLLAITDPRIKFS